MSKSRYGAGWGTKDSAPAAGPSMKLAGKTFDEIKSQHGPTNLFEDPDFPAVPSSLFYSCSPGKPLEWKRPHEILAGDSLKPEFLVGGASRFDVQQGELGDCWLLAAISCVSQYPNLLQRLVPTDQNFVDNYAGIFKFNLWQYGKWTEVFVDDRLPTHNGRLVYMHSAEKNEFWSSLLEKAYAKLNGSYESLKGGSASEAMEDFTGGVTEFYDLGKGTPPNMFTIMLKAYERNSLMGCSIDADPRVCEAQLPNGLIMGHAYSVTGVKTIDAGRGKVLLIRCRNPWGNECEWKGAWGDKSPEWKLIDDKGRKELGLTFDDDGEFWMSYQDFTSNFQKLEICNLGADALIEDPNASKAKKCWEMNLLEGCWKKRVNAGGCRNYIDTFWTNPQYRVEVIDPDEDDDDNNGTVLIALMQKERKKKKVPTATLR